MAEDQNEEVPRKLGGMERVDVVGPIATSSLSPASAPFLDNLPNEFLEFLKANGVPLEAYGVGASRDAERTEATPSRDSPRPLRYVRVNPRSRFAAKHPAGSSRVSAVAAALGVAVVEPVTWLTATVKSVNEGHQSSAAPPWADVYACDADTNLSRAEAYRDGSLYGIDAASVFAVRCLDPQPGDRVLDLCCAPGAKLCVAADAVEPGGEAVGVDVAEHRLAACRTVVLKYGATNARLSCGDGVQWSPRGAMWLDMAPPPRTRGERAQKKRRLAEAAKIQAAAALDSAEVSSAGGEGTTSTVTSGRTDAHGAGTTTMDDLFDRVLVDAECTHDGSLRHIEKYRTQWGWATLGERVPWVRQQEELHRLQSALLANGFRLLREGGVLIYATCSLCRRQNEDIVERFLELEPSAALSPLPLRLACVAVPPSSWTAPSEEAGPHARHRSLNGAELGAPARPSLLESSGPLGADGRYCTARFDPAVSGTSGLFLARFVKCSSRSLPALSAGVES